MDFILWTIIKLSPQGAATMHMSKIPQHRDHSDQTSIFSFPLNHPQEDADIKMLWCITGTINNLTYNHTIKVMTETDYSGL